jgi:hypothetical protein
MQLDDLHRENGGFGANGVFRNGAPDTIRTFGLCRRRAGLLER